MAIIFLISTDLGSAAHTSQILVPLLRWVNPDISPTAIDLIHTIIRKGGHLTEYAILALLSLRAVTRSGAHRQTPSREWSFRAAGIALLVAGLYAATDEFHQSFIPSRTASIYDVMIDTSGAFVALSVVFLWKKARSRTAR